MKSLRLSLLLGCLLLSSGCSILQPAKQETTVFLAPPAHLMAPCEVHDIREFVEQGNSFSTAEEQLAPITAWGIANTGELGKCNRDKLDLRVWVNKQKEIYEKGK